MNALHENGWEEDGLVTAAWPWWARSIVKKMSVFLGRKGEAWQLQRVPSANFMWHWLDPAAAYCENQGFRTPYCAGSQTFVSFSTYFSSRMSQIFWRFAMHRLVTPPPSPSSSTHSSLVQFCQRHFFAITDHRKWFMMSACNACSVCIAVYL